MISTREAVCLCVVCTELMTHKVEAVLKGNLSRPVSEGETPSQSLMPTFALCEIFFSFQIRWSLSENTNHVCNWQSFSQAVHISHSNLVYQVVNHATFLKLQFALINKTLQTSCDVCQNNRHRKQWQLCSRAQNPFTHFAFWQEIQRSGIPVKTAVKTVEPIKAFRRRTKVGGLILWRELLHVFCFVVFLLSRNASAMTYLTIKIAIYLNKQYILLVTTLIFSTFAYICTDVSLL